MGQSNSHQRLSRWTKAAADYVGMVAVLILLVLFFSIASDRFFSQATFLSIANRIPATVVIAVGMTYVLVIAGIDLSVGSVLALSGATLGVLMVHLRLPLPVAVTAALGAGLLCGGFNGLVSVRWSLPSFIVTLGMLEIARGGAHLVSSSQTQYIGSPVAPLAEASVLGLTLPFWLALVAVGAGQLVLSYTVFGRYMVAIGTNEEAVRLSGIDPRPIKVAVFLISGLMSALAGVIEVSRFQSADPNLGTGLELDVIAAVVIGGTSLMGGRGSVVSSFFGVLIIAVLGAGLASLGARDETKRLVTGCVIVAAVILDYYRHRLGKSPRTPL